ncbi:MAG: hypothetical protein JWO86_2883 [Myxococcaceae bacterium]|nr:hypothetical protein [Myxococcaceae bacterium]
MQSTTQALARRSGRPSLLSDQLVRDLVATGQVEVIVGLPTLDNAATVGRVVRAVYEAFAGPLARERTMLLNADGGSMDGTADIVRGQAKDPSELVCTVHTLRTVHRVSTPYHGLPGRGSALRLVFAAADLLRARAIVIVDPDATSLSASSVAALVTPVLKNGYDLVKPVMGQSPWEAPLMSQLVRPLMRAAYGKRLREPLATQFACSGAFAVEVLAEGAWDEPFARYGLDAWLCAQAMASRAKIAQVWTRGAVEPTHPRRPALVDVFEQVVGAVGACLEADPNGWLSIAGSEDIPILGEPPPAPGSRPAFDLARFASTFAQATRDLAPLLGPVLGPDVLAALAAAAESSPPSIDDALWVRAIYAALAAFHHRVLSSGQVVQAMVPIYEGRVASFFNETATVDAATAAERLEALAREFERQKPALVELWTSQAQR